MYTIYSKPACAHCVSAKTLLKSKDITFKEIILDVGQPKDAGQEYITRDELLAKIPTAKTMPQIFKGDTLIGGFAELRSSL